jgi:hypothetical protein
MCNKKDVVEASLDETMGHMEAPMEAPWVKSSNMSNKNNSLNYFKFVQYQSNLKSHAS